MTAVSEILSDMGVEYHTAKGGAELQIRCPFHADTHPSTYVNSETGAWFCHAGCGGGSFPMLLDRMKERQSRRRVPRVESTGGASLQDFPAPGLPGSKTRAQWEWAQRGFTISMLNRWGMRWDAQVGATKIPVMGEGNVEISHFWRLPQGREPRYRYLPGFVKSHVLFPFDRLLEHDMDEIVVVEGPLDAIWLWEAGIPAVAILGAFLSDEQLRLLVEHIKVRVVMCFDNDAAGTLATEMASRQARDAGLWALRVVLPAQYKDIQEVPHDQVESIVSHRELCLDGVGVFHSRHQAWLEGQYRTATQHGVVWRYGNDAAKRAPRAGNGRTDSR